jgi:hypothetical protein
MEHDHETKNNIRQGGFGVVGIIAVVVVVAAVLAGISFVVFKKSSSTKAAPTPSATPTEQTPAARPTATPEAATPASQYLHITEWGVKASYSTTLTLSYTLSSDGTAATFSSTQLSKLSNDCVGRGGAIKRWAASDKVTVYPTDASPTAESTFAKADPSTYAHIGNYYYTFLHDQAACGDPTTTETVHSETNDAVKALVSKLQAASN